MTSAVLGRPLATKLTLRLIGMLTLVAVADMRLDRQDRDFYITDDFGNVITDGLGNGITIGREYRLNIVVAGERVPLLRQTERW